MIPKELTDSANNLRKNGKFAEAIEYYKKIWENYRNECNEWIGWGYALSLSKLKMAKDALNICEQTYAMNPNFENIKNTYAWALYNVNINLKTVENEQKFLDSAELITQLSTEEAQFSPYSMAVLKVLTYLETNFDAEKVFYWLGKLNAANLSKDIVSIIDKKGKTKNYPSKFEFYNILKVNALYKKRQYEEVISIATNIVETIPGNKLVDKLSFYKIMAHSKNKLGMVDQALENFKYYVYRKPEWGIYKEIAEIFYKRQDYITALLFADDGALCHGEYKKKTYLFTLLAKILKDMGNLEMALKHVQFNAAIKTENGWKVEDELHRLAAESGGNLEQLSSSKSYFYELRNFWNKSKYENMEKYVGFIQMVLPGENAGFVQTGEENTYYFKSSNFKGDVKYIQLGQAVTFYIEVNMNLKKKKPNKVAVHVTPIDENGEPLPFIRVENQDDFDSAQSPDSDSNDTLSSDHLDFSENDSHLHT